MMNRVRLIWRRVWGDNLIGMAGTVAIVAVLAWAVVTSTVGVVTALLAAVAAVAALLTVLLMRETLGEAQATTRAQAQTTIATKEVAHRIQDATSALGLIVAEAQAARELEQVRFVANQVAVVIDLRQKVSNRRQSIELELAIHTKFTSAKDTLAIYLASIPAGHLPKCRALADRSDARLSDPQLEQDAIDELQRETEAIGSKLRDAVETTKPLVDRAVG
jgi:hypothetical protein